MPLPIPPLATASVTIGDTEVPIRSLTRDEVIRLGDITDEAEAEVFMISAGADVPADEAVAWRKAVNAPTAGDLILEIAVLSGIRSADLETTSGKS